MSTPTENYFAGKSSGALYSANARYKQKLSSGKTPTQEEQNAHFLMEERKSAKTRSAPHYLQTNSTIGLNSPASLNFGSSPVTSDYSYSPNIPVYGSRSLSPRKNILSPVAPPATPVFIRNSPQITIAPISPRVITTYSAPSRSRAKSPRSPKSPKSPRSPRTLSPEAREKAVINVTNARYVKKIKNGQTPTAQEIEAHNIVEANKVNSPRASSPRSTLSAEEKRSNNVIRVANARYAKKIKNGQRPTAEEIEAHNIIENDKVNNLTPANVLSPTYVRPLIL